MGWILSSVEGEGAYGLGALLVAGGIACLFLLARIAYVRDLRRRRRMTSRQRKAERTAQRGEQDLHG